MTSQKIDHDSWLYLTVASIMWTARALDVMHEDSPNRSYLRGVARTLNTRDVLRLPDEAEPDGEGRTAAQACELEGTQAAPATGN